MREMLKFYIDGNWVDPVTPNAVDVINPATEEPCGRISLGSPADVDLAVAAVGHAAGQRQVAVEPGGAPGGAGELLAELAEARAEVLEAEALGVIGVAGGVGLEAGRGVGPVGVCLDVVALCAVWTARLDRDESLATRVATHLSL